VYQQIDAVILGKLAGDVALGFYAVAKTLATVPVDKIAIVLNQFSLPIMANLQDDRGGMRASFLRALRLAACLIVPASVGLALVADDFVYLSLGDKWSAVVPVLRVLCAFGLVHAFSVLLPPVLFARYRATFVFWWNTTLLLVMPFAFWAGAAWGASLGVALATAVVYPVLVTQMARETLMELRIDRNVFWQQLGPVFRSALVMALSVVVVRAMLPGSDWLTSVVRFGLASSVGALVYGIAIFWRGGPLIGEIAEVAGWLFPRGQSIAAAK
jgi:O-antigen/teichoic acid export membrane protein